MFSDIWHKLMCGLTFAPLLGFRKKTNYQVSLLILISVSEVK